MVLTLDSAIDMSLTPEEALEAAEESLDPTSLDSLVENAWILSALGNDRDFLPRFLNEDLKRALDGGATYFYSSQSMLLGQRSKSALRVNFWYPSPPEAERGRLEKKLYSYEMPHDHNFHFATLGYLGPGYRTDIYRYERDEVKGLVGELVDLRFSETIQLIPGKLLVFESGRDVHTQYAPEALSISLNLLCRDHVEATRPQYLFDSGATRIVALAEQKLTRSMGLAKFAKFLGNEETIELLDAIIAGTPQPMLRAAGFDALIHLAPGERERIERRIGDDRDPLMGERVAQIGDFVL